MSNKTNESNPLFGEEPRHETPGEAWERLKRMSTPGDEPPIEKTSDFPEERTLGDDPNRCTPEEAEAIEKLVDQKVAYAEAFQRVTKREYYLPSPERPLYGRNPYSKGHPKKPSSQLRGRADERSSEDPWLR